MSCMNDWKDEYLAFDSKYKNHVNKFVNYLSLDFVNKSNTPAKVTIADVEGSVRYYNQIGKICFVNSMANHLEAIKAFYSYMIQKGYINYDIFQNINYSDFKDELTVKYSLKSPQVREYFENEIVCEILDCIDNYFYTTDYSKLSSKKKKFINRLSLRVFIKLGLIAPAKKNVLVDVTINDFIDNYRFLIINNVKIRIPNSLRANIISALDFTKNLYGVSYKANTPLFNYLIYGDISQITKERKSVLESKFNELFCSFLKEYDILDVPKEKTTYSVEAIMNTALYNLVKNGANPYYISKISGIKIGSLETKYYNKKECINYDVHEDKEINFEISKSEYYNYI